MERFEPTTELSLIIGNDLWYGLFDETKIDAIKQGLLQSIKKNL